jgi:hypothetical protein
MLSPRVLTTFSWHETKISTTLSDEHCKILYQERQTLKTWLTDKLTLAATSVSQNVTSLELSPNSTWFLVGSWRFCIQHLRLSVSLRCILEDSVKVWKKYILYPLIEGQTHFGIPRGAKMSLALNTPTEISCSYILIMHHKWQEISDILCRQTMKNYRDKLPIKKSYWVEG